jgi:hypothetical protein
MTGIGWTTFADRWHRLTFANLDLASDPAEGRQ